jgi:hypothetical protein
VRIPSVKLALIGLRSQLEAGRRQAMHNVARPVTPGDTTES